MPNIYESPPSRLSITTAGLRETLIARNLYTPNVEYPLSNESNVSNTVGAISSVIGGITPFKSFDLGNTAYGRAITIGKQTPLVQIGLAMLSKQMVLNSMSNLSQQVLPVIKLTNLFDGDPKTHLITPHRNFAITRKSKESGFGNFIKRVIGKNNPSTNPFSEESINKDYLDNTGKGQLVFLYDLLNKNVYKPDNQAFIDTGIEIKNKIQPRGNLVSYGNRTYFNQAVESENPYTKDYPPSRGGVNADQSMIDAYNFYTNQEYAPDYNFIVNLGTTYQKGKDYDLNSSNGWIDNNVNTVNDNLAWGRDGVDSPTNTELTKYRGNFGKSNDVTEDEYGIKFRSDFNVNGAGLLEYTRNLVRATGGKIGDITRKAFMDGDKIVGFNGSGMWTANNSTYAGSSKTLQAGKNGVRQHTVLDQYDRFAKAIRFDGNNLYGGSPDSVIYNSVLPRIHPVINKKGELDNKSLMLSIENLAIKVISNQGVGIIDDEYGSEIPACEVGPFNGRIMWFPPYAMEIQETATAKYEPIVMVGRNEPMYNYQNSERTATLNFTLLVDYPPHVRNYANGRSKTPQKDIAEFFAFGGNKVNGGNNKNNIQLRIEELEIRKSLIKTKKPKSIIYNDGGMLTLYFPNDVPRLRDNLNTIIDTMYENMYEIGKEFVATTRYGGTRGNLNGDIYYYVPSATTNVNVGGVDRKILDPVVPTFSQYNSIDTNYSELNKMLFRVFTDVEAIKYYDIVLRGTASKLHNSEYNKLLSLRRINAVKVLIEKKLETKFGQKVTPNYVILPQGEEAPDISKDGAEAKNMYNDNVKKDRYTEITIKPNSKIVESTEVAINSDDQKLLDEINIQISSLTTQLGYVNTGKVNSDNLLTSCVMNEREKDDTAILHGFESINNNYFYPVFHSQTPEDFHKRLTFLQQCTRQGSSNSYGTLPDEKSKETLRAKNSVFGRQPICILRVGDFFYTKVIIESVNIDYTDTTWDMNPEGFGMQPMMAKVTLNMKVIGGQSLKGPIDALQNAVSYNYYANSTYTKDGMYLLPSAMAAMQDSYTNGVNSTNSDVISTFKKRNNDFMKTYIPPNDIKK